MTEDKLEKMGYARVGENLWRRPPRQIPGFVKTKDPRDFDGYVPEFFAAYTGETALTGERMVRFWYVR